MRKRNDNRPADSADRCLIEETTTTTVTRRVYDGSCGRPSAMVETSEADQAEEEADDPADADFDDGDEADPDAIDLDAPRDCGCPLTGSRN